MTLTGTFWPTFLKTLTFAINFEPLEVELSYFKCSSLVMRSFQSCKKFWPSDIDHNLWSTYLNFNLVYSFWTVRDKRLDIWHVYSTNESEWPCDLDCDLYTKNNPFYSLFSLGAFVFRKLFFKSLVLLCENERQRWDVSRYIKARSEAQRFYV